MPEINMNLGDVKDEDMGGRGYKCFEPGKYLFHATESEIRETKAKKEGRANRGRFIKLVWECLEPGRKGKVFENINIENDSEEAERIGRAQLKECAIACGVRDPNFVRATEELHLRPVLLTLKKVKALSGGDVDGMTNEVVGHDPADFRPDGQPGRSNGSGRREEPPPIEDDSIPF